MIDVTFREHSTPVYLLGGLSQLKIRQSDNKVAKLIKLLETLSLELVV